MSTTTDTLRRQRQLPHAFGRVRARGVTASGPILPPNGLTDGTKREVVKQYLLEHPDRVAEDTQANIASDLGVDDNTVHRAIRESEELVKLSQQGQINTDERRQQVRECVEDNPTVSDREVAREVD